jgi:predicted DNA-binding protein (UPF0251 family)
MSGSPARGCPNSTDSHPVLFSKKVAHRTRFAAQMSIAEVAHVLEVAPGTVKASLSHARDKVRLALSTPEDER